MSAAIIDGPVHWDKSPAARRLRSRQMAGSRVSWVCLQVATVMRYLPDLGFAIGQYVSQMGTKKVENNDSD